MSADPPSLATGYAILAASAVFFVLGSYATLFSAFWPRTGVWVRRAAYGVISSVLIEGGLGAGRARGGHALQVFRAAAGADDGVLCHCELGWVAILQEFMNSMTIFTVQMRTRVCPAEVFVNWAEAIYME